VERVLPKSRPTYREERPPPTQQHWDPRDIRASRDLNQVRDVRDLGYSLVTNVNVPTTLPPYFLTASPDPQFTAQAFRPYDHRGMRAAGISYPPLTTLPACYQPSPLLRRDFLVTAGQPMDPRVEKSSRRGRRNQGDGSSRSRSRSHSSTSPLRHSSHHSSPSPSPGHTRPSSSPSPSMKRSGKKEKKTKSKSNFITISPKSRKGWATFIASNFFLFFLSSSQSKSNQSS